MDLVLVSEILPNYKQQREVYGIDRCDLHPNAKANEQIARYLVDLPKSHRLTGGRISNDRKGF